MRAALLSVLTTGVLALGVIAPVAAPAEEPVRPGAGMAADASNAALPAAFANTALAAGVPLPDITRRMPGQGNDASHGYAACSNGSYATCFWRYLDRVYQQGSANTGYPQWAVQNAGGSPLPANATSASAYGAWGVRLLNSGYAGHLFQVTRASDSTTLNIDALSGGQPNLAPLQTFCAGTSCGVSTLYDQVGANNCTQATQASMPPLYVDHDGSVWLATPYTTGTTQNANVGLTCSGVSLTKNSLSVAAVVRRRGSTQYPNMGVNIVNLGNSYQLIDWLQGGVTTAGDGGFGAGVFSGILSTRGDVVIAASGASTRTVTTDAAAPYAKSAFGAIALSGMTLGMSPTGSPIGSQPEGNNDYQAVILWAASLSNADQAAARRALYAAFPNLVPQARCTVALWGESVLADYFQDAGQGSVDQLRALLPSGAVIVNQAWPSQTDAQMASNYTQEVSWLYNAQNPCNILVMNPALNGIASGESVATVEGNISSFVAAAQATGWKVAVMTEISRKNYDTQGQAISAWIRANVPALGGLVIDVAADPLLGATGAFANGAVFQQFDQIHLTDAGAAEEAGIIANTLIGSNWLRY